MEKVDIFVCVVFTVTVGELTPLIVVYVSSRCHSQSGDFAAVVSFVMLLVESFEMTVITWKFTIQAYRDGDVDSIQQPRLCYHRLKRIIWSAASRVMAASFITPHSITRLNSPDSQIALKVSVLSGNIRNSELCLNSICMWSTLHNWVIFSPYLFARYRIFIITYQTGFFWEKLAERLTNH